MDKPMHAEADQLVAVYENAAAAEAARQTLAAAGVEGQVEILHKSPGDAHTTLWDRLKSLVPGLAAHEHHAYAESFNRGHAILSIHAPAASVAATMALIRDTGPIDFDTRQDEWRAGGWAPRPEFPPDDGLYTLENPFAGGMTLSGPGGDLGAGTGDVGLAASRAAAAGSPGFARHTGYSTRLADEVPADAESDGMVRRFSA